MRWILFLSFSLFMLEIFASIGEEKRPLPIWVDEFREVKQDSTIFKDLTEETPPPREDHYRYPAEYEKHRAVVVGNKGFGPMLRKIIQMVQEEGKADVWATGFKEVGYPIAPEFLIEGRCPLDTVWMRDYGPFAVKSDDHGAVAIVDSIYRHFQYRRNDDRFPSCLAGEQDMSVFSLNLILDGGNLMTDTKGNLFMTKVTYKWNSSKTKEEVDLKLKEFFGVHTIHALDFAGYPSSPKDGTGHIDMFLKLLDDNTFVLAESQQEPFKSAFEKNYNYLKGLTAPNGRPYKIIRLPGRYSSGAWYTYTNSLIVNGTLLMPSFSGNSGDNELAKKRYEEGLPKGYKVIPIESDDAILYGGSIHCVTQTIPE